MVDTIHHGTDLTHVIRALKNENIQVSKVFCYIKNKEGVAKLVKHGLLKEEQIVSLFTSHSELEYRKITKNLHAYFRSRSEPIDSEICYNVYNINTQLIVKQLVKIMEPILYKIFGNNAMEKIEDKGFASNIQEVNYKTVNNATLQKWSNELINSKNDYEVLGLNLRIKINQRAIDSEFLVIPKIEADCIINKGVNDQKCLTTEELCMLNYCKHDGVDQQELKNTLCPQCLDSVASDYLLNVLDTELAEAFKKSKMELILKEEKRPVNFE